MGAVVASASVPGRGRGSPREPTGALASGWAGATGSPVTAGGGHDRGGFDLAHRGRGRLRALPRRERAVPEPRRGSPARAGAAAGRPRDARRGTPGPPVADRPAP